MNDNELSSLVRESVADIRSSTPVDQIISRGHAVRAWRRRVPAAAGALVMAGGAALGVTVLAPSGHPAPTAAGKAGSHPAVVGLAAWTVAKQANGDIDVTIKQFQHPAQLQATLRADGLPASVSFSGHPDSAVCQPYRNAGPNLNRSIYASFYLASNGSYFLTIHPSLLPSGVGLSITVEKIKVKGLSGPAVALRQVYASLQCTG
ncbi:MAG TPA: hypothetical protein VK817_22455 [Trebonia sp.]|jgi:hypothetical protein|nr:hypothetical protein [Trebonia sp.]